MEGTIVFGGFGVLTLRNSGLKLLCAAKVSSWNLCALKSKQGALQCLTSLALLKVYMLESVRKSEVSLPFPRHEKLQNPLPLNPKSQEPISAQSPAQLPHLAVHDIYEDCGIL